MAHRGVHQGREHENKTHISQGSFHHRHRASRLARRHCQRFTPSQVVCEIAVEAVVVARRKLEELFVRAFDKGEFDVAELSFSNYVYLTSEARCEYAGLPIFPSRTFRHSAIYVRTDRNIHSPRDLVGRLVGVREPESFQRSILNATAAWAGKSAGLFLPASAADKPAKPGA